MNKKVVIISVIIILIAIGIITIGIVYPKFIEKDTKEKESICSISAQGKYYQVKYESNYNKYSVVEDSYAVIEDSSKLNKILKGIGCDNSNLKIDFSNKKVLLLEVLTEPRFDTFKINDDSIDAIVLYNTYEEIRKKDTYNLYLIPINKNIEKYNIRISPIAISTSEGPSSNE